MSDMERRQEMKDIVIWGTGVVARSSFYTISKFYNVKYFLDNAPVDRFYGRDVYRPTKENCSRYPVVVASNIYYKAIAEQLLGYGLEELRDIIPWQALGRKVVLLHGNCYKHWIRQYLQTSKTFLSQYWIYPLPRIYHLKQGYIREQLLKNCDVLISQDVQENNQFDKRLSFQYLSSHVNGRVICIPNVFGLGKFLFPQAVLGKGRSGWKNPSGTGMDNGMFMYSDTNIDRLWEEGERDIDKIVKYLESDVYSKEEIEKNAEACFAKWEKRDQDCDVKIMDYIRQEYKKQRLFYEPANPCNNVMRKISERILKILEIDPEEIQEIGERRATLELPVYQCVKEALGLEFDTEYIREVPAWEISKLVPGRVDLAEYCREYCYWCHDWNTEHN